MIQDKKKMLFDRLKEKNLDQQFKNRIEKGVGCSPFVSEAICNVAREVYFPILDASYNFKPGQIMFTCLSAENGSSQTIKEASKVTVLLTLNNGDKDMAIRRKAGVKALRRHRIIRMSNEAYNQGGLLTVEDLAYQIFNLGERTINRDLAFLKKDGEYPPLRSIIKDMGRTISHRVLIIKHWLSGDELSDLQRKYNHSFSSLENYISTFKRVIALQYEKYTIAKVAYLLKISQPLVKAYVEIWGKYKENALPHRLAEISDLFSVIEEKKTAEKRRSHS